VWAIAAFKRFRNGRIEIHETGNIQVGYGGLGASVALIGTLRGIGKEMFVKRLQAIVERRRDGARSEMGWSRDRANGDGSVTPVSGFLLTPARPINYNILFAEEAFTSRMAGRMDDIASAWNQFLSKSVEELSKDGTQVDLETVAKDSRLAEQIFSKFLQEAVCHNLWTDLDHAMYWEPGEYRLQLRVESAEGHRFSKSWNFRLTEDDSKRLRVNSMIALRAAARMAAPFASAYPSYEDAT
jgi:hypothetical protein